jgi:hypothetical protein
MRKKQMSLVLVENAGKLHAKSSRWLPALSSFRNGKYLKVGSRDETLSYVWSVQYRPTVSPPVQPEIKKLYRSLKWTSRYFFEMWDKIRHIELILCNVSIYNTSIYPSSRVLHGRLTDPQLVKKFPTFYVSRLFITSFKNASHLSLFWARATHSTPPQLNSWKFRHKIYYKIEDRIKNKNVWKPRPPPFFPVWIVWKSWLSYRFNISVLLSVAFDWWRVLPLDDHVSLEYLASSN